MHERSLLRGSRNERSLADRWHYSSFVISIEPSKRLDKGNFYGSLTLFADASDGASCPNFYQLFSGAVGRTDESNR